ncbi:xpc-1, partial [Pristionchus pacificus]
RYLVVLYFLVLMSTEPRRSLRLRSSNVSDASNETDKSKGATASRHSSSLGSNLTRMKSKRENNSIPDEVDTNKDDAEIEKKLVRCDEAQHNVQQSRKRAASTMGKNERSDEEEESDKEEIPAKTRRTGEKADKVVSTREDSKGLNGNAVVQSKRRPRRECVRKTTVERYDDLMSGSASSSDVTSSESEVDDSDLEKEIEKAKKRRGGMRRKVGLSSKESSSDSVSEEDDEEEEEDEDVEEMDNDEPFDKGGRSRGCRSSSRNGGKSGMKKGIKRQKMENRMPVEILHDKEYDVDYDEMVAWEAKSVKMVRDLRELERERANGGQIMDTVNEFIQRCLKDGRMIEMDEKESIRVTHVHENELAEMNRKKKMTVVQRIKKEIMEKRQKLEEENEDESEEDEWEEMEPVDGMEESKKKEVEVRIDTKKKLNAPWKAKWIRQEVNREVRQRCENIHKAHLISYIAHLRHLMALAKSSSREKEGIPLSVRSLSLIPFKLLNEEGMTNVMKMEEIIQWWRKNFSKIEYDDVQKMEGMSERMDELMENLHFETTKDAAILFSSFLSHLNLSHRIIARCVVTTKKAKENNPVSKKGTVSKNKTTIKKENDVQNKLEETITYWCEIWNDEENTWKVFDPFVDSPERAEKKESKEKISKKDQMKENKKMVNDFIKSWNSSTHVEPFRSYMEKDGSVLYFIAVDNDFNIRDVSSRYINGKDLISRDLKGRRANEEWLMELWENKAWAIDGNKAKEEENEWIEKIKMMDMPTTVAAFKDHPIYVLNKDVLKMQIIFPYDTKPIGEINKYKIYLRKFVRPINTPKWYEKMGRQIKKGEPPCGEKQVTNPMNGETGTQGLYGYWQTEEWNGGEVIEGRIPRNEFGNVYLYQREMIPRGCIYLEPEGLQRLATELSKDFVPAVIAWYYKGGTTIPLIRGAVFIKEDLVELVGAWKVCYKRWKDEERKIRSERCIGRWKKLIKGMMRLAAMRKEFEPIEDMSKGGTLDDDAVREEEKASWPQKKYGGDMFEEKE